MKVGVTGHQKRSGIDWAWVAGVISGELTKLRPVSLALTSLAIGSDQTFAECALLAGIPLVTVIPLKGYERFFEGDGLSKYQSLLSQSEVVELSGNDDPEAAFDNAGKFIVRNSDVMFAIWDEKPAAGLGGTGDAVAHAQTLSKDVIVINPITRTIKKLGV